MSILRRFWVLIALVIAIIALTIILGHRRQPATSEVAPAVEIVTTRQGEIPVRVEAHGRVGPPPGSAASLAFVVSGKIQSIDVHVGQQVSAGQALAQLDTQPFALAVDQARGDADAATGSLQSTASSVTMRNADAATAVRQAELKVQADERALQRVQTLYSAGVAATKDVQAQESQLASDQADARAAKIRWEALVSGRNTEYDPGNPGQARADVLAARGQAERAQAALAQAERELAGATLRAPSDGVVVAVLKHPGESVDPTIPVVTVGAPIEHTATLSVAGDLAARIHVGDNATLRVARSKSSYSGEVVAVVAAVDPTTQQATVVVNGLPPTAFAGDAVDASIVVGRARGILIPTAAIVQDPQTGNTLVFVQNQAAGDSSQKFSPRVVSVGASDSSTTQILSGLRPGEKIAAQGAFELLAPAGDSGD